MADTYSHEGPQCPYCKRQYTADEPGFYDESNYTEETCDSCGKTFSVSVSNFTTWSCDTIPDDVSSPVTTEKSNG